MRVVVKQGEQVVADLSFEDDEIVIGSDPQAAVCLAGEGIGLQIARLDLDNDDTWRIERLDVAAEVLLNDKLLAERRKLAHDDLLTIGGFEVNFRLMDDQQPAATTEEPAFSPEELAKIKEYPLPPNAITRRHFDALNLSPEHLERISRTTVSLASGRDVHEVVDATLQAVLEAVNARMAWMGVRRKPSGELDVVAGRLPSGQTASPAAMFEMLRYRCLERSQHICVRKIAEGDICSVMAVPLRTSAGTIGLIYVDRQRGAKRFQLGDLDILSVLSCQVAAKLEALFQERTQRTAEQSVAEINLVHSIQTILDPKGGPTWRNLNMAAYGRSGQDNPGDVYDIMKHPDTNMSALMLGHVNATGASLALSMARLHSTFRVGYLHMDPPHALARTLNWLMYDEKDPATSDALFLVMDPATGKFRYTRAGRIGGFIVNNKGEPRLVSGADGPSIGRIRNYEYTSKVDELAQGETLCLYTRGVATATNGAGERFREKRFIEAICDGFGQRPSQTLQDVTDELTDFFANGRHPDDITIVLLHHSGNE